MLELPWPQKKESYYDKAGDQEKEDDSDGEACVDSHSGIRYAGPGDLLIRQRRRRR